MKIVHVNFSFTIGGIETMLIDIVNEHVKNHDVTLIIVNNEYDSFLFDKINKNVKVILIDRSVGSKNPIPLFKINFYLFIFNPEVIHFHNHNGISLVFPIFYKKSFLTVHDTGIKSVYFKKYHKIFAISKSVQKDLYHNFNLNSFLVYNGIDFNSIIQKKNISSNSDFKCVVISRLLHEKKGQDLLIHAFRKLIDKGFNNISLDIIGVGVSESFLKGLVDELELNKYVHFLGLKDRDYIYHNLINYDLLIQPSRYEGFGLTVIEAMASKIRVLVSDIEGPMEIINKGEFGYFFSNNSIDDLVFKLEFIINTSIDVKEIENSFEHAFENFSIKNTCNQYINLYSK